MAKYRIVSRNCNPYWEPSSNPWYYLQVKILNRWWVDSWRLPFGSLKSFDTDYQKVHDFYVNNCSPNRKKPEVVETVVKVFENDGP